MGGAIDGGRVSFAARLLDLTRVLSRAGNVPTGIDRVEAAYLRYLLQNADTHPAYGLVRTALGYVLLDRDGLEGVRLALESGRWPFPDSLSISNPRLTPAMRRGQTLARKLRKARCRRSGLAPMLKKHLPGPVHYINVGHSNLTAQTLEAIRRVPGATIHVMIHDTIPLDHPEWQRPGTVSTFRDRIEQVATHADRVITIAESTCEAITPHLSVAGRVPPMVSAHLGLRGHAPAPAEIPKGVKPGDPYFVTLGTIEPRKNHELLLDVWDALEEDGPTLLICGSRGWNNEAVFDRLDRGVLNVREVAGLSDGAIAALIAGSRGLLFPSFAEGFGLPPVEAAMQGVPVVCGPLPVYEEILGDRAIYLDQTDLFAWKKTVERLCVAPPPQPASAYVPPRWDDHFKTVFTVT